MNNYRMIVLPVETESGVQWTARFPDINNVGGGGNTLEEAIQDAKENLEFELQLLESEGKPLPPSYKEEEFSGKLLLRIPKYLHKAISERAEGEGTSINQLLVSIISERIGFENGVGKTMKKITESN